MAKLVLEDEYAMTLQRVARAAREYRERIKAYQAFGPMPALGGALMDANRKALEAEASLDEILAKLDRFSDNGG